MKKVYVVMAVLATAALSSCVREKSFERITFGENEVAFSFQGASTRSGEAMARRGAVIALGNDGNGNNFFLEETIEDLEYGPATKGTPAYTENVKDLYKNMDVIGYVGNKIQFPDAVYESMDATANGGWLYHFDYGEDKWPDNRTDVRFFLRMPASASGVDSLTYDAATGKMSFRYASPENAQAQQDILFTSRLLNKNQHLDYLKGVNNGSPVLFHHALTAVKFAMGNTAADTTKYHIAIKEVTFEGLYDKGVCTVTPNSENDYRDVDSVYSSATAIAWKDTTASGAKYSSGTFNGTVDYPTGAGSFENKGNYPKSFSAAGNTMNLNDKDASQTFWFIPQRMTDKVKLTIKYMFNGEEKEWTIDFGSALSGVNWKAGQLRTYSIRVDEVNVKIEDHVTVATKTKERVTDGHNNTFLADSYRGSTKDNVVITNTGNTDAYIRAAIIGQWLDSLGHPVFGFTDYTTQDVVLVDSWYQDQFVTKDGASAPARTHGKFVHLPGYDTEADTLHNWKYNAADGYYYYMKKVPAGEAIPTRDSLFTRYTVLAPPAVKVAGGVRNVYFQLEIATQAISAKKTDGSDYTYEEAWNRANNQ